MVQRHSVNESCFRRILGTKHRKCASSFLEVAVAEFRGSDIRCLALTVQKAGGPTLRMTLLGHEA